MNKTAMAMTKILMDIMPSGSLSEISSSLKNSTMFYIQLLCIAVAAICSVVAGLRIYSLWNIHGRHHIQIDAQVVAWGSAAIFFYTALAFVNMVF
jgi:hypothetical protein